MMARRRIVKHNVEDTMDVDRSWEEITVTIRGVFTKGTPDVFYLKNGDPGHPGDPDEVEDIEAIDDDGNPVELDDAAEERARELLVAKGIDEWEPQCRDREDD